MPRTPTIRPTSCLSLLTFVLLSVYYLKGFTALPETLLLPLAGQVIAVGIHSLSTMIFSLLVRYTTRTPLPLDSITPFLINLDTHLGGALTPERLILAPLVMLIFLHTPETLLGTLAAGKPDIRSLRSTHQLVELGPFGGAFNRSTYFLSGQLLLSWKDPDLAYPQVAYNTPNGWVIPRKPTVWYEQFSKDLLPDNNNEKRIAVHVNEAAVLQPVASLPQPCNNRNISDFRFWLTLHHCDSYVGFSFGGGTLPSKQGFYRLHLADVSAKYSTSKGSRFVEGSAPRNMRPVSFPRADAFWKNMKYSFLNAISFNRTPSQLSLTERLVISAVVRIAGIDDFSGFSTPPAMADAIVSDVVHTNISRWVVFSMALAVAVDLIRVVLSFYNFEILPPELESMVASMRHLRGLASKGRNERGRRAWFRRIWGYFERKDGRWYITRGLDDGDDGDDGDGLEYGHTLSDIAAKWDTATETGTDRTSTETL